jgi:putative ABC transport system permease protein
MSGVLSFASRSLVRQPARSTLGILGVAAVGALLFDMLLLSEGLVLSMRDMLDRMGFDVRVTMSEPLPGQGADIENAPAAKRALEALPAVRSVTSVRSESAAMRRNGISVADAMFISVDGPTHPWTLTEGRDIAADDEVVVNQFTADTLNLRPGSVVTVSASCGGRDQAPPRIDFRVVGVVTIPFEPPQRAAGATTIPGLEAACGGTRTGVADFLAVASSGNTAATIAAIAAARPDLTAFTNEQIVGRLQQGGFTYFRQISTVLITVTVSFALLLITVLLTVSVNQRVGEVAALRALGFSRRRVVLDVFCESALIVGTGGLLSLPLGWVLATTLDDILKRMPGIPEQLHFFVFRPDALVIHAALLCATALLAAVYPMQLVARLPIATTLRNEVIG